MILSVLVCILTLLYLNTAVVLGEGGGGSTLVFRPFHGIVPFYGGGEEGSWRRAHPNEPDPWWHTGTFTRLASFDDEATTSAVVTAYYLGYYATILGIVGLLIYHTFRRLFSNSRDSQACTTEDRRALGH